MRVGFGEVFPALPHPLVNTVNRSADHGELVAVEQVAMRTGYPRESLNESLF